MTMGTVGLLRSRERTDDSLLAIDWGHWELHELASLRELRELIAQCNLRVALVRIDECFMRDGRLEELIRSTLDTKWIALVDSSQLEDAEIKRVVASCFCDYHRLPVDAMRLRTAVGHAWGMSALRASIAESCTPQDHGMVGASPAMLALCRALRKVASVHAPTLIEGESGTGKELAARAVHARSDRCDGPFIAVDCAALPANLIHSELFGYERGAFTGATGRRRGRIETAAGGTIFLDEIGDLSADLQVHLLRFLQERTIERLGGNGPIEVDARVIAATHVDLEAAVAEGRFRQDLYYRLNVLRVHMPALRDRGRDIELLARFFFEHYRAERSPGVRGFSRPAIEAMERYDWPGNVRELINRVRRAMVMCDRRLLGPEDLGLERRQRPRQLVTLDQARRDAERDAVLTGLRVTRHNVSRAADQLGVSRVTLYRLMDRHDIRVANGTGA